MIIFLTIKFRFDDLILLQFSQAAPVIILLLNVL
jgi:hypothetical protein